MVDKRKNNSDKSFSVNVSWVSRSNDDQDGRHARDFLAILGRGPRAFPIGKISDINPEFGKFSEYSKSILNM